MKQPQFTKEQAHEMCQILIEIHDALRDKSMNDKGIMGLSQFEIGWYVGIGDFFNRMGLYDINHEHDEFMKKYFKAYS
jgi:hypothetical protein